MEPNPVAAGSAVGERGRFDASLLRNSSWRSAIADWLLSYPHRLMSLARRFTPVFRVPFLRWVVVLRYDEVREVLSNSRAFPVAWGHRMIEVTNGKNFVLGMPPGPEYQHSYKELAEAFPREDVPEHVAPGAGKTAREILAAKTTGSIGELDAIEDLVTAVPAALCESYYGLQIADKVLFAQWTLAISAYLFGPSTKAEYAALAREAAAELRKIIHDSITSTRAIVGRGEQGPGVVLPRMVRKGLDDATIHGQLFGMVLGFIPTNVLAGGNIVETLLRRPEFLARARAAALADDDDLLWRCLREALRFRHINPGPWRLCPNGYVFGAGGPKPIRVAPGRRVLAIIQSAMFDSRRIERPHDFDPERRDEDYLVFGVGQHWCLGAYIAIAQITQTLKPLLKMTTLEAIDNPKVRTERFNDLFPLHLRVRFFK